MDNRIGLLSVDAQDATPIYMQLARKLTDAIEAGHWLCGEALPSERTLVEGLQISRVTARRAIQVLADRGLIRKDPGAGTFIAPRFQQPLSQLHTFTDMVRPMGFAPKSEVLLFQKRLPTEEERTALCLQPKDQVVFIMRLRKADSTIISLDNATLPAAVLSDPQFIGESLYEHLENIGQPVLRAVQRHKAAIADKKLAGLLDVKVGDPLGMVVRLGFTHADKPIELTTTYCVNEHYEFVVELKR